MTTNIAELAPSTINEIKQNISLIKEFHTSIKDTQFYLGETPDYKSEEFEIDNPAKEVDYLLISITPITFCDEEYRIISSTTIELTFLMEDGEVLTITEDDVKGNKAIEEMFNTIETNSYV